MPDYAMVGRKGTGKTKNVVRIMRDDFFKKGLRVATNIDINLSALMGKFSKCTYVRVPDKPTGEDMAGAGHGNPDDYNEDLNGGLFLDEMATWLNTRSFSDKSRSAVLDFFAHGRKLGWSTYYIMQDVGQVDKQLRESFIEYTVRHRRFDKVKIPFIGGLLGLLFGGKAAFLPRFHVGVTRCGTDPKDLQIDRAVYRGDDVHAAYDTRQIFRTDYPHGCFSVLSPWHMEGRFLPQPQKPFWEALFAWATSTSQKRVARPVGRPSLSEIRVRELCRKLYKEGEPDEAVRIMRAFIHLQERLKTIGVLPSAGRPA